MASTGGLREYAPSREDGGTEAAGDGEKLSYDDAMERDEIVAAMKRLVEESKRLLEESKRVAARHEEVSREYARLKEELERKTAELNRPN